jgi:hypothetical protein
MLDEACANAGLAKIATGRTKSWYVFHLMVDIDPQPPLANVSLRFSLDVGGANDLGLQLPTELAIK